MLRKECVDKNGKFFESQFDNLIKKHKDKFVIIKDEKVLHISPTKQEATEYILEKKLEVGTFIVQRISKEPEIFSRLALR